MKKEIKQGKTIITCHDEDCPRCGFPETLKETLQEIKITDIEWYESKNTPFGSPYYLNRPPAALYQNNSPFKRIGLQFIPETKDRIIYTKLQAIDKGR